MSENRCEDPKLEICHRFSPPMDSAWCLRCGHIEQCHVEVGLTGQKLCRFAAGVAWLGDHKTAATCREKFKNLTAKDFVLPVPSPVADRELDRAVTLLDALNRGEITNDQISALGRPKHEAQLIPGSVCACVCGCVKPREPGRFVCHDCWAEIKPRAHAERMTSTTNDAAPTLTFDGMKDLIPTNRRIPRIGDGIDFSPWFGPAKLLYHMDIAKMRADLYDALRTLQTDRDLEGFTLARIHVRPGEFQRLTSGLARYENNGEFCDRCNHLRGAHPTSGGCRDSTGRCACTGFVAVTMNLGQVGAIWIDAVSAMVPVFESAFMPDTMTTKRSGDWPNGNQHEQRRVVCMLQYEREAPVVRLGTAEVRLRIVTE